MSCAIDGQSRKLFMPVHDNSDKYKYIIPKSYFHVFNHFKCVISNLWIFIGNGIGNL